MHFLLIYYEIQSIFQNFFRISRFLLLIVFFFVKKYTKYMYFSTELKFNF